MNFDEKIRQAEESQTWDCLKYITIILMIIWLFSSCTKEVSNENSVKISISGKQYQSSVNGSPGFFWAMDVKVSRILDSSIQVVYIYDDSKGYKGLTINQAIIKGETENIFYTQYPAIGVAQNIRLIRVDGMARTNFVLKN